MSDQGTQGLAQSLAKQLQTLVHRGMVEFTLRSLLNAGMTADEVGDLMKDVLHEIKDTPARDVAREGAEPTAEATIKVTIEAVAEPVAQSIVQPSAEHNTERTAEPIAKQPTMTNGESSAMGVGLGTKFAGVKRKLVQSQPTALKDMTTTTNSPVYTLPPTSTTMSEQSNASASSSMVNESGTSLGRTTEREVSSIFTFQRLVQNAVAQRARRHRCMHAAPYDDWMSPTWRSDSEEDSDDEKDSDDENSDDEEDSDDTN